MKYNEKFGVKDLLNNERLSNLFPQFTKGYKLEEEIAQYICRFFNGNIEDDSIKIVGNHKKVLKQVNEFKHLIEELYNRTALVERYMHSNAKLITPFQSIKQLQELQDGSEKLDALEIVVENFKYNPNFIENTPKSYVFIRCQNKWLKKVGRL